jgi:dTDP-4-dehydrorhamnose 3,5-epimerase
LKLLETKIPGLVILEPDVHGDHRGWFVETYNHQTFEKFGITADFVQDNHSFSTQKGTLRGIHLQNNPFAQAKLVRCTRGAVLDVAVDLRKFSPTYKQWVGVELTAGNFKLFYIPRGFGHAFLTLTENVEFQYKVDNFYSKKSERSVRWDDPELGIDWGMDGLILSEKDQKAPLLKDCDINFA